MSQDNTDVNIEDKHGYSPLEKACQSGNITIVRLLIRYGADIKHNNYEALRQAAESNKEDIGKISYKTWL